MKKVERYFDINMILMTIFSALESIREEKGIELVYDIDATIPKELKGDSESVAHLLTQLLLFVFQNTDNKEVVLGLRAPEDFLYEESITFEIDNTDLSKLKAESFFNARLKPVLERLDSIPEFDESSGKISVSIPFKLKDLGNRRYYRLPDVKAGSFRRVFEKCFNTSFTKLIRVRKSTRKSTKNVAAILPTMIFLSLKIRS